MSEIKNVFDVAGRAMAAQMVRLNTVASNLANANSLAGSESEAYKPLRPVFETIYADNVKATGISTAQAVEVTALDRRAERLYKPEHPKADADGFVFVSPVNMEEEFVEMLEASRQYQNNVEVVTTLRTLMMRTINMGK
jgi:flagellar basal-body rod protein FlgC